MPGITFPVDPVQPASQPLSEIPYDRALVRHLLDGEDPEELLQRAKSLREGLVEYRKKPTFSQVVADSLAQNERHLRATRLPIASSRGPAQLVDGMEGHPFLRAVTSAYAGHRPLALSPDAVWLLIAQGAASHIRANAKSLRAAFVLHAGKMELRVAVDGSWPEAVAALTKSVAGEVGPKTHAFFVPTFSTTGPTERTAFGASLLDAMGAYFRYSMRFVCGIPEVTLLGTPDDWGRIAERVELLGTVGLERWRDRLRPVIEQFVRASEGDIDMAFWQGMFLHTRPACGGDLDRLPEVTGWVALFFPYLAHGRGERRPASWLMDGKGRVGCSADDPGSGLSVVPFLLQGEGGERPMELVAGFVGMAQDGKTLRPEIGWAVREAQPAE